MKTKAALRYIRKRSISQVIDTITQVRTGEPLVALTFDDGPHPQFTPLLLDLLAQYEAKATFFMVGKEAEKYPEVVQQVINQGQMDRWSSCSELS